MAESAFELCLPLYPTNNGESVPPAWAVGAQSPFGFYYFANLYGEQWVARQFEDQLAIAGMDVGWKEVCLTVEEAEYALNTLEKPVGGMYLLSIYTLGLDEALWARSVIVSALPSMKGLRRRKSDNR